MSHIGPIPRPNKASLQVDGDSTLIKRVFELLQLDLGERDRYIKIDLQGFLISLDLSSLNLSYMPKDLFKGMTKLRMLDLSFNDLFELDSSMFNDLVHLRELRLDNNQLIILPEGVFNSQINLHTLYLHNNQIHSLPYNLFSNCDKLRGLTLTLGELDVPNILLDIDALYIEVNSFEMMYCSTEFDLARIDDNKRQQLARKGSYFTKKAEGISTLLLIMNKNRIYSD